METRDSYRNQGCDKQETWISNLLNFEDKRIPSAILTILLQSQHEKSAKTKFWKLNEVQHGYTSKDTWSKNKSVYIFDM